MDDQFFGGQFGGPIQVDRVDGLIRAERQHLLHTGVQGRLDHVGGADDVGLDGFHRIVLTGRDLLECCGVDDHIYPVHGAQQAVAVAHVADEIAQGWMRKSGHAHLVLLEFIAAEDDDLLRFFFFQQDFSKLLAKRARPTGDENYFIFPIHICSVFCRN